jgi:diguanylate cyclase (GGDEF)-like protein
LTLSRLINRGLPFKLVLLGLCGMLAVSAVLLLTSAVVLVHGAHHHARMQLDHGAAVAARIASDPVGNPAPATIIAALRGMTGDDIALLRGPVVVGATGFDGYQIVGHSLPPSISKRVLSEGRRVSGTARLGNSFYYVRYVPLFGPAGHATGAIMAALPVRDGLRPAWFAIEFMAGAALLLFLLLGAIYIRLGRRLADKIDADRRALDRALTNFETAIGSMAQGFVTFDANGRLVTCNERFGAIIGAPPGTIRPGMSLRDTFLASGPDAIDLEQLDRFVTDRLAAIGAGKSERITVHGADDRPVLISERPMAGGGWVAILDDLTDKQQSEAQITFLRHFDRATRLPNRALLAQALTNALARPTGAPEGASSALITIDIPRLKAIHDSFGPEVMEALLDDMKQRMQRCLRSVDMLARSRMDEFCVLPGLALSAPAACRLAERLLAQINGRYDCNGQTLAITASAGIAIAPEHGAEATQLMQAASIAARMTPHRPGGWQLFRPEMEDQLANTLALEADLDHALADNQIELYYQPLVNLQSNAIVCFEALMRWHHPTRGLILPAEFVPIAEETGMIVSLGAWALARACKDAMKWPRDIRVAVNLSACQLRDPGIVTTVEDALAKADLDASRLELEVTETVLLEGDSVAPTVLHALRAMGVRISMDDFGTGHASLSYLRDFPFDKIKIDRSFVREILRREDCLAIIRAVTGLAGSLGIAVAAEGAENAEQVRRLRAEGCAEVQGFFYSEPRPARDLLSLIARDVRASV